ncbi:MAG TPA: hypothetical protein VKA83_03995, partial [Methylomirabilota bacterium]|nr:hypothetical protein [Methylomirabilota bacterium]
AGPGPIVPREASAPAAKPGARIAFESVDQPEEEEHERDRPHRREQGFFDGHAGHPITPPGLSRPFAGPARYDAGYRNVNTFSGLEEIACVASP